MALYKESIFHDIGLQQPLLCKTLPADSRALEILDRVKLIFQISFLEDLFNFKS